MLDQRLIREDPSFVEKKLSTRGKVVDLSQINRLTVESKEVDIELCNLQSESKKLSKVIGSKIMKLDNKESEDLISLKNKGNEFKSKIMQFEEKKRIIDNQINYEMLRLPNLPSDKAPLGNDESNNVQIRVWGNPNKDKHLKSHWEIGENLNLFDFSKTTKISKSRFSTLRGDGAKLERSLINFMIDMHSNNGYLELMPPALVNSSSLQGSGQLPKFSEESFK